MAENAAFPEKGHVPGARAELSTKRLRLLILLRPFLHPIETNRNKNQQRLTLAYLCSPPGTVSYESL